MKPQGKVRQVQDNPLEILKQEKARRSGGPDPMALILQEKERRKTVRGR